LSFAHVERRSLPTEVAEKIGKAIVEGSFSPGAALPTELDLTQAFGVSRTVLREALKILGAKGLIASRPKSGTIVLPSQSWNTLDVDVLAWRLGKRPSPELINAWFDFRSRFEPFAARVVAEKGDDDAAAQIQKAYEDMVANQTNLLPSVEADIALHQSILEASGNEFLVPLGRALESALRASFLLSAHRHGARDAALPLHGMVVEAIRNRDSGAAEQHMADLIETSRDDLLWVISH
jgi:DNA-binding FadR family transcriptional regulator